MILEDLFNLINPLVSGKETNIDAICKEIGGGHGLEFNKLLNF